MGRVRRVLAVSDLHAGSSVGLWPPGITGHNGTPLPQNPYQEWLYKCWQAMLKEAKERKPDAVVVVGDPLQGGRGKDAQSTSQRGDLQFRAAKALLEPLVQPMIKRGGKLYVVAGTEWHDGPGAENVEVLAEALGAVKDSETDQYSRWELWLKMCEQDSSPVVHFTHHIGVSGVPWGEATAPLRDLHILLGELARSFKDQAPNVKLIVRAHRHRMIYVQAPPDIGALVLPGWQLRTSYVYKKASAMLPQLGYAWIEWDGSDLVVKPRMFDLPALRTEGL